MFSARTKDMRIQFSMACAPTCGIWRIQGQSKLAAMAAWVEREPAQVRSSRKMPNLCVRTGCCSRTFFSLIITFFLPSVAIDLPSPPLPLTQQPQPLQCSSSSSTMIPCTHNEMLKRQSVVVEPLQAEVGSVVASIECLMHRIEGLGQDCRHKEAFTSICHQLRQEAFCCLLQEQQQRRTRRVSSTSKQQRSSSTSSTALSRARLPDVRRGDFDLLLAYPLP